MSWFQRLSGRLGEIVDELTLPESVHIRVEEALRLLDSHPQAALATLLALESERAGLWRVALALGETYERLQQPADAAVRYEQALQRRDDAALRLHTARLRLQIRDHEAAAAHLRAGLALRPPDGEALEILRTLASTYQQAGVPAQAVAPLLQALQLPVAAAEHATTRLSLAHTLHASGDVGGALDALAPILDEPQVAIGALHLAAALFSQRGSDDDLNLAARLHGRILARAPQDAIALEGLAKDHLRAGRLADALPLLHQAIGRAPVAHLGRLHTLVAEVYRRGNDATRALDALDAATSLDPEDAVAWRTLAWIALQDGQATRARDAAETALRLSPTDRRARAALGRALLAIGARTEARTVLAPLRAARMEHEALLALGELALAVEDPTEAIALLREADVQAPGQPAVAAGLRAAWIQLTPDLPPLPSASDTTLDPAHVSRFLDAFALAVAAHPQLTDLVPRTTALRQQLDTPLTIAIVGEFNAGKSTLINAWLQEDVLAMGVLPTTSHINVLRYGPRRIARWTKPDGSVHEIPYARAAVLTRQEPDQIRDLEFCFPHPDLRAVHFWDTPGLNAPDDAHEARAQRALTTADAIIWLLDAAQALSQSELTRLGEIADAPQKLLVVVNKVDRLGDDPDALAQVMDYVQRQLAGRCVGLFPLSGRMALTAATLPAAERDAQWERSGFRALLDAIDTQFQQRAGHLKALEAVRAIEGLLDLAIARADAMGEALTALRDRVAQTKTQLQRRAARLAATAAEPLRSEVARAYTRLRHVTHEEARHLRVPRRGLLPGLARQGLAIDALVLPADERVRIAVRMRERALRAWHTATATVLRDLDEVDNLLISLGEDAASTVGPPESRTLRGRVESYLAQTAALRPLLHARITETQAAVLAARQSEAVEQIELLSRLALPSQPDGEAEATEADGEAASALQLLLPIPDETVRRRIETWGQEYLQAALGLCGHLDRDLEILALDLELRIVRRFRAAAPVSASAVAAAADPPDAPSEA